MSESTQNQPEDVEFAFSFAMIASYVLSISLFAAMLTIGKSENLIFGFEKRDVFPIVYNLFWFVFPMHLRMYFSTEFWIPNAHKTLHYLIRIQAVVAILSLIFPTAGLQIGVFVSLISLLVCSGIILWTVNKTPLKTGSWLAATAILGYIIFSV